MIVIMGIFALLSCNVAGRESDYCLAEDENPYLYFAMKAPYHFMRGKNAKKDYDDVYGCKPVQIFMIVRHGTRYFNPNTTSEMKSLLQLRDQIVRNHEELKMGHLCDTDLQNLKYWQLDPNVNEDMVYNLTPQGEKDLKELGSRIKEAFPDFLKVNNYSTRNRDFLFRSSKTQRTEASMAAFMEGLFGSKNAITPIAPLMNDTLLQVKDYCPAWSESLSDGSFLTERTKFNEGLEMKNVFYNVSRRLGFTENLTLSSVNTMYEMCRMEKAWRIEKVSPWCAAFSKEELHVIEYREDLDYYHYVGPGRDINAKLGCAPMKDMFEHFRKLEDDNHSAEPKGIFYFSHSVTLQALVTALGLWNDPEPLLASNYKTMEKRQWRGSLLFPFATNFVAVFYKCNGTGSPNKVMFHWAERLVNVEGCNVGLCDWEYIENRLGKKADECNMDFCTNASGLSPTPYFIYVYLLILLIVSNQMY